MTLIIIEGADGVGKTTLTEAIAKRLADFSEQHDYTTFHSGPPKTSHLLDEYLLPLQEYDPRKRRSCVVLDRWHLGELVYPPLIKRKTLVTRESLAYLELFLLSRGAMLVHVTADIPTVYRRRTARREPSVNTMDIGNELALFYNAVSNTRLAVRHVNTSDPEPCAASDVLISDMLHQAGMESLYVNDLAEFPTYVGSYAPYALVLGDERGQLYRQYITALPPVAPSSPGQFLLSALPDELLLGGALGFANAADCNPYSLWKTLGQPHVVALGRKAYDTAVQSGLEDVGVVPHPQFIRNFHSGRAADYGSLIAKVIETKEDMRKWPQ